MLGVIFGLSIVCVALVLACVSVSINYWSTRDDLTTIENKYENLKRSIKDLLEAEDEKTSRPTSRR